MVLKYFRLMALVLSLAFVLPAHAADDAVMVVGPQQRIRIAFADPLGSSGQAQPMQKQVLENLALLPFASLVNSGGVPGGTRLESASENLDFNRFQLAGAHMLVTSRWTASDRVEQRVYDVTTGKRLLANAYTGITARNVGDVADTFCADLLKEITGRGELFLSTLAFVKSDGNERKDIWAVKVNGRNLAKLSNLPGMALSPAWSKDGRFVVFSHVDRRTHALGVWDSTTRAVQRIRFPGNTVIGPAFLPDNRVAVSLSDGRYPSIFLLDHQFKRQRSLESSSAIDVSPSIDATGTKMAFVSNRMGNPHVFLKDLSTGAVRRVTYEGKYNTEPSISPDGTLIVFSRQVSGGHRIFVHDLVKNTETQLTFGPGSDEQPAFAPDNYFIAFTSTRSGTKQIYLTTRNGGEATLIPTGKGDAAFPAWGLPRRQQ